MLTQDYLKAIFTYDPSSGELRRKRIPNRLAGCINWQGYRVVSISDKSYNAHRLIWLLVHGEMPTSDVDHINGIKDDNRLENLRSVSHGENISNSKIPRTNKTGYKHVHIYKGKYRAQITNSYGKFTLGLFATAKEAAQAVENFKAK